MKGWEYERCPKCNSKLNLTVDLRLGADSYGSYPEVSFRVWCEECDWIGQRRGVAKADVLDNINEEYTIIGEERP